MRAVTSGYPELVAPMFAEVLLLDEVGHDESFFDLDGDSLTAVELIRALAARFGVTVGIGDFFAAPTVNGIAALLATAAPDSGDDSPRAAGRPEQIPLSPAQEGIWFASMLTGWAGQYNLPVVLRGVGGADRTALETAIRDVVTRHEILRTRFPERGGVAYQEILDAGTAFPGIRQETRGVAELSGEDFDVTAAAPLRASSSGDDLILLLHHLAADGLSLVTLMRDLDLAYGARRRGAVPVWPGEATQYADFTLWQRRSLEPRVEAATAFWRERLRGIPAELLLASARPRSGAPGGTAGTVPVKVPADLHERALAVAREADVTLFMVLQATFAGALAEAGAGTDIVLGVPVSGRTHPDLEDAVGLFVNLVALRTDLSGAPGLREVLHRVRTADAEAFRHADLPFAKVVEAVAPRRRSAVPPVVQVSMTIDGDRTGRVPLPEIGGRAELPPLRTAKFDLGLVLESRRTGSDRPDGLQGWLEYATGLYDASAVEDLRDRFTGLLARGLADPDAPLLKGS